MQDPIPIQEIFSEKAAAAADYQQPATVDAVVPPTQAPQVRGCHLVGSVPGENTEAVFRKCFAGMPGRLRRIPDGETGARNYFVVFQAALFSVYPKMMINFADNSALPAKEITDEDVKKGIEALKEANIETGYDTAAIESYAVFRKLRDEGVIPKGVKFQVCLPTIVNTIIALVEVPFQAGAAPIYEEALFRAMKNIQEAIPHEDLSIQLDLALDTALWEGADGIVKGTGLEWFRPYWDGDVKQFCIDMTTRMIDQIATDVEIGIHNCYGDMEHRHWYEPKSLAAVVQRGIRIMEASSRPISYFHAPVPKSAADNLDAYVAPLEDLKPLLAKQGTELMLGVIHEGKPELTLKMIQAAGRVVPSFGAATECGCGRISAEDFEDVMTISKSVSDAIL